jgi:hypothetical protein
MFDDRETLSGLQIAWLKLKCKTEGRKKDLLTDTGGMYVKKISFDD